MAWAYSRNYVYFERELIERAAKLASGWKIKEKCKFWHNDLADGDGWIRLSCARVPRIAVYAFSTGEYRDRENELSIVAIKGHSVYGVNSHKYGEFLTAIKPMLEDASKGYSHEELLFDAFCDWLPYYWTPADDIPEDIRLHVLCNGYPNVAAGCNEIVNHELKGRKIHKKAGEMLRHMQVWKEMPDNKER